MRPATKFKPGDRVTHFHHGDCTVIKSRKSDGAVFVRMDADGIKGTVSPHALRPRRAVAADHDIAIRAHLTAHEAKIAKRRKARASTDQRKKKRGLDAAIVRLQEYRDLSGRALPVPEPVIDLTVQNEGSIFLLRALSDAGRNWIDEHIPDDAQHFGGAVVVEHRYIGDIVQGAVNDGLEVE